MREKMSEAGWHVEHDGYSWWVIKLDRRRVKCGGAYLRCKSKQHAQSICAALKESKQP